MSWNYLALLKPSKETIRYNSQAGFGLVELMVSISIMVLVTSVILVRQSSFDSAVLLRSQTYEIALQAREIQLSAVSAESDGSDGFRSVLGLYFDTAAGASGGYKIFKDVDSPSDGYTLATDILYGKQGILDSRFFVKDITVGGSPETAVSVMFERPNFDAMFFDSTGTRLTGESMILTISRVGSASERILEITSTGQIDVQ